MRLGPGLLVAAAFVGPGTVTTCVLAGQGFGTALLWALVFAVLATIVLQEMAARLGAGAGLGLGEAVLTLTPRGPVRIVTIILTLTAILLGNAAYQAGNLTGAALGVAALLGEDTAMPARIVPLIALVAAAVLLPGRYKLLERTLILIVALMSFSFLAALAVLRPSPAAIGAGLLPRIPDGGVLAVAALIGTTIVPYNLFLHAAAAREKWTGPSALRDARRDTVVAIVLGGVVSAAILLVAATGTADGTMASGAAELARVLEPSFGAASRWLVGVGLLAAGVSSAITAPMAAGFVSAEIFGGERPERRRALFRWSAMAVLVAGTLVGSLGLRPTALILVAQAANSALLPLVAVFLLMLMNHRTLGVHRNGALSNLGGGLVVVVTIGLGLRGLLRAAGVGS